MKYFTFYRENGKFDDILKDAILVKRIYEQMSWHNHLRIGIKDDDKITSYVTLKYGDEMRNQLTKDYSPIVNVDYRPKRKNYD